MCTHILTIKENYVNNETHIPVIDDFYNEKGHSKNIMSLEIPKIMIKKIFNFFLSQYIRMKNKAQKSIILKRNFKKLISILLRIAKKVIRNQINQIKLRIMCKIWPNKVQNTPKRVSDRGINEKPKNVDKLPIATKPKIAKAKNVDKPPIATKPKIAKSKNVDKSPIATKPEIAKPKNVDKSPIAINPK